MFSQESIRSAVQWLLVAAAGLATLAPVIPGEPGRGVCLRIAALLLLLDAALLLYYGLRFGRAFLGFLTRRISLMLLMLAGITLVSFLVVRFAPGDPVSATAGEGGDGAIGGATSQGILRTRNELLGSQAMHFFRARAIDPDGDRVRLEFDWGDESRFEASPEIASGTELAHPHIWWRAGRYAIRVRAIDEHGARSAWSPPLRVEAREGDDLPPAPPRPRGPAVVAAGTETSYTVDLADPGEDVAIIIDWGDDTRRPARRTGDGALTRGHTWRPGLFDVRARAVGPRGAVSEWSEPLAVAVLEEGSPLVGPNLSAALEHGASGDTLSFTARAASRSASELTYALRVREDGDSPDPAPPRRGDSKTAPSGSAVELSHTFLRPGDYLVGVSVVEGEGGARRESPPLRVRIHDANRPPLTPAPPEGPERMHVETTIVEQYLRWLTNVARLEFGMSHRHRREVWPLIWEERLPTTLILSALSLFLAYLIAIPIGVYSATHRHSVADRCLGIALFTLYSMPSFWVATMLIVAVTDYPSIPIRGLSCGDPSLHPAGAPLHVPLLGLCLAGVGAALAMRLARRSGLRTGPARTLGVLAAVSLGAVSVRYLPASSFTGAVLLAAIATSVVLLVLLRPDPGLTRSSFSSAVTVALVTVLALLYAGRLLAFDLFWHALLPVACLTYGGLAALSRYARSGMLDVVRQDYIRTARAKGLPERTVIFKHALRSGLIPLLTVFASVLPQLISGSVIVESIFSIEGMGLLLIESVRERDYNVTMAVTTLAAIMTMLGLLLSDVLYVVVDPRIRFERRTSA